MLLTFSNAVEGPIPTELGILAKLRDLELAFNALTGQCFMLRDLGNGHVRTCTTECHFCYFAGVGHIPTEIGKLTHLASIVLSFNQLSGPCPTNAFKYMRTAMYREHIFPRVGVCHVRCNACRASTIRNRPTLISRNS